MECSRISSGCHRLHYHWSQLEEDRSEGNVGSHSNPHPKPDRVLHLDPHRCYDEWPSTADVCPIEDKQFSEVSGLYKTIEYNTFSKNGALKLTEIELSFISSFMTKHSVHEWVVVYLGIGNGERFRHLRDEYFPGLAIIAYDPIDEFYTGDRQDVIEQARVWSNDGTDFTFHVRCFDADAEVSCIREAAKDKQLLLISDIRGVAVTQMDYGSVFDKATDQELQWKAIQALRPVSSLLKFTAPNPRSQFYWYPPGVILKQTFIFFGSQEMRLRVDGVPAELKRYNNWEIYEKLMFHHKHMRGLVYGNMRHPHCSACLDSCFDCTVLWDTVSSYAAKNAMDAHSVLDSIVSYHVYSCDSSSESPAYRRWWDVETLLKKGYLMEAVAALEAVIEDDIDGFDWVKISNSLFSVQPDLAQRLRASLPRPASRRDLLQVLASLSDPFTLLHGNTWEDTTATREDPAAAGANLSDECTDGQEDPAAGDSSHVEECTDGPEGPAAKKPRQ
mmetsp:Transcript_35377/g.101620  ORF Transcript_35377/g.101620 Transcript_35377/m.101620 type:complete len:502 (-) Transcript_35377:33-1538(-)